MAHNLVINNINISIYSTYEIDNMSQIKVNKLAKKLTMKGNNINNIKNIFHEVIIFLNIPIIRDQDILPESLIHLELSYGDINTYLPKLTHLIIYADRYSDYINFEKLPSLMHIHIPENNKIQN